MRRKTQAQKTSNTAATGQLLHDAISRDAANSALPMIHDVLNSPGQSLDPATHAFIKPSFGHDFSQVRVHTDHKAAESARSINALAYTVGQDIVFGAGQFAPKELSGMRLLAHELTHVSQNRGRPPGGTTQLGIDSPHSPAEHEAFLASRFIHAGITAKSIQQSTSGIARTPASMAVTPLISYSATDWEVTGADERAVLAHLRADSDISRTIADLNAAGMLDELMDRIDDPANRAELVRILGARLDSPAHALVEPYIARFDMALQLQFNMNRLGVTSAAPAFNRAPFASLVSSDPRDPFTGVGASGADPTSLSIPAVDQYRLWRHDPATSARYSNPLGDLPAYLATLTPAQRSQQAELMLRQQISSVEAASYRGGLPSRAQVIRAAASAHNLHPQLVAAILLAEQRDQSRNEDAKDYLGATSVANANTSIGLGQVVISTAQRNDLFADLLSPSSRAALSHDAIARLLASDEFNIFAAARYIRVVADAGSKKNIASLPNTQAVWPAIDLAAYASNSSTWPEDNFGALGMYYTSRAWTDNVGSIGWGEFVVEAYRDVIASGVF